MSAQSSNTNLLPDRGRQPVQEQAPAPTVTQETQQPSQAASQPGSQQPSQQQSSQSEPSQSQPSQPSQGQPGQGQASSSDQEVITKQEYNEMKTIVGGIQEQLNAFKESMASHASPAGQPGNHGPTGQTKKVNPAQKAKKFIRNRPTIITIIVIIVIIIIGVVAYNKLVVSRKNVSDEPEGEDER